jgi:hypothetical protein
MGEIEWRRPPARGDRSAESRVVIDGMEVRPMSYGWIPLLAVLWALGVSVALILFRMASDQDRAARHAEKALFPHSDVSITQML